MSNTELAAVCVNTNRKIQQILQHFKDETAVTSSVVGLMELKALFGILIVSGAKGDNHISSTQIWPQLHGCPLYRSIVTERRFCFLMRTHRFEDSTTGTERVNVIVWCTEGSYVILLRSPAGTPTNPGHICRRVAHSLCTSPVNLLSKFFVLCFFFYNKYQLFL